MTSPFLIEPLAPNHDRAGFSCGVDALDRYFRQQAGQDVRRRVTACFVARDIATDRIAGFYTLAAGGILLGNMPAHLLKGLPHYPAVPVARWDALQSPSRIMAGNSEAPCCGTLSNAPPDRISQSMLWWSTLRTSRRKSSTCITDLFHSTACP